MRLLPKDLKQRFNPHFVFISRS